MPPRPGFWRLMLPLIVSIVLAMLACAVAFKLIRPDLPVLMLVMPAVLGSALCLLWMMIVLRRRWVAPVRHLAEVADRMTAGDWGARADASGAEDPRALAGRLNLLAAAAQQQLAALDHQRSDLQQLVDSLPDPILLSDAQQRLILINTAATRLLQIGAEQALGKKLIHVVSDAQILELFEPLEHADKSMAVQRDIRIVRGANRNYYQAVATRTRAGGVLIVLRNVTTMASAIQMKTDFVANASHELRTPIAAIKIAFDTLRDVLDEDPEQTRRCVQVIDGHLNRLEEMLRDLLDLSRVETAELRPEVSPIAASALSGDVQNALGSMARQKGVELVFDADPELSFSSDKRLLDLILKNLVENAIKFTPSGGSVTTSIRRSGQQIVMSVTDTGVGIPPEHLDRVFERFYQVGAARTGGGARGTGLGLAIVKHAIHALGGSVQIRSQIDRGTTVTCEVPDVAGAADASRAPAEASAPVA